MSKGNSSQNEKKLRKSSAALLMIDIISDFEFEDGDVLLKRTLPMARRLSQLREKARSARVPVIYVNDNFGQWKEDFKTIVSKFSAPEKKGREVVELLRPGDGDYFILKPHRSAFYSTSLMLLLQSLKVRSLIITGVTTDICVMFTANDAYMRGFEVFVPEDCVAAVKPAYSKNALDFIRRVFKADTRPSTELF